MRCSSPRAAASPRWGCRARPGVTEGAVADTVVVPFNDVAALDAVFTEHGDQLAAVLVERVPANMGLVPPAVGFLEHLRTAAPSTAHSWCATRSSPGSGSAPGARRAGSASRPTSRSSARSSAAGCRWPPSAGRADVMAQPRPARDRVPGRHAVAGTRSRPPPGSRPSPSSRRPPTTTLERTRRRGSPTACAPRRATPGSPVRCHSVGTLSGIIFGAEPVRDYEGAQAADHATYARFFHHAARRGVFLAPSGYEVDLPRASPTPTPTSTAPSSSRPTPHARSPDRSRHERSGTRRPRFRQIRWRRSRLLLFAASRARLRWRSM